MSDELRNKVNKIKERVLTKNKKPLTSDFYVLLEYIQDMENILDSIKDDANTLADQSKDLMKAMQDEPMFMMFDLKTGKSTPTDNHNNDRLAQLLDLKNKIEGQMQNPFSNPYQDVSRSPFEQEHIRKFLLKNKNTILEEADNTREKMVEEYGENSMEVNLMDMVIRKIENLRDDDLM